MQLATIAISVWAENMYVGKLCALFYVPTRLGYNEFNEYH